MTSFSTRKSAEELTEAEPSSPLTSTSAVTFSKAAGMKPTSVEGLESMSPSAVAEWWDDLAFVMPDTTSTDRARPCT